MSERNVVGSDAVRTVLYRIVKANPPSVRDFWSQVAKQRSPMRPLPPHLERLWDGISVYDSEERARTQARRHPRLGRFIAALLIPERSSLRWEQTTNDPEHFTIWGDPTDILACLALVGPVETTI